MAVTGGVGLSRIERNRRFEDYKSLKQHFQNSRKIDEVIISGRTTTDGALAEINFCVGDTINYIAAEGQAYIRTEIADATQNSKYVYLQYQDDTGAVLDWVTADLDAANTTTEVVIGSTDFYRVRQMYSEVESVATKGVLLTDAAMGGADDIFGFINDAESRFNLERFFTQPSTVCDSYLAYIRVHSVPVAIGAGTDTYLFSYDFTPRALNAAEAEGVANKTLNYKFTEDLVLEPCILLQGGTEVTFKVGDTATANEVYIEAVMVEVYPDARP